MISAPVLSNIPADDDMEQSIAVAKRMVRKYLEAADAEATPELLRAAAQRGYVPKPIQMALRVAELDARDKVADKGQTARVFHTFLPKTELAAAPPALRLVNPSPADLEIAPPRRSSPEAGTTYEAPPAPADPPVDPDDYA